MCCVLGNKIDVYTVFSRAIYKQRRSLIAFILNEIPSAVRDRYLLTNSYSSRIKKSNTEALSSLLIPLTIKTLNEFIKILLK